MLFLGCTVSAAVFHLLGAVEARAVGMGVYLGAGTGSGNIEVEVDDQDTDLSSVDAGFVFDTAVAKNKVFNYRLKLGYSQDTYKYDYGINSRYNHDAKATLKGVALENTFGFAIVRTAPFRLWIGPQLHLSYRSTDNLEVDGEKVDLSAWSVGMGIAPVLGANFNIGPVVTLGVELGYLVFIGPGQSEEKSAYYGSSEWDTTFSGSKAFCNFVILFRAGDTF